jgi:hypothetical protein
MVFTLTTEAFGISAETTGSTTTTVSTAMVARTILAEALATVEAQGVPIRVKVGKHMRMSEFIWRYLEIRPQTCMQSLAFFETQIRR